MNIDVDPGYPNQPTYRLCFNNALAQLFLGCFQGLYLGPQTDLATPGALGPPFPIPPHVSWATGEYYWNGSVTTFRENAEKNGIYLWNSINKIYLTSDLPIREEALPGTSATTNILTDFVFIPSESFVGYNRFQYYNQGNLKWIDFTTDQPLSKITITFKYQTYDGNSNIINLIAGQNLSYKFIFRRKKKLPA